MAGPRKPSSPTPDWRAGARPVGAPRTKKHVMRAVLTAMFLGLAALFTWLLWPAHWPGVQLAVLPVTGYDIALPPVPFSPADVTELTGSLPEGHAEILSGLQDSENLKGLYNHLQGLLKASDEVLILYVSAHGVSDAGTPYLLCSDFMRGAGSEGRGTGVEERGRLPLDGVLRQVQQCRARTKLVLLDCTHIDADPRLGMVVNEFPHLLEGVVKKIDDPHLWVLACCRPLEVSQVSYAEKRSLFAHFVTEGFRGLADANDDHRVDLAELYGFVRDGVTNAVAQEGAGDQSQRPMLYHGGEGPVASPPREFLFRVRPKSDGEQEAAAGTDGGQGSGKPFSPAARGRGLSTAAGAQITSAEIRSLLSKAWEWRDKAQDHAGAGNWSPVDYAPHLWREYQDLLLGHEMRYRLGTAWTESSVAELRALAAPDMAEGGFGKRTMRGRLAEAAVRLATEPVVARFKELPENLRIVEEAVKLKDELVLAAPYYVRWCARSAISSPESPVPMDEIATLVGKKLPEFITLLETFEEGNGPASPTVSSSAGIQESLKELRERKEDLEKLRAKIERDGLEQGAAKAGDGGRGAGDGGNVGRIEALLATPLLSAKLRMSLLDALDRAAAPPEATAAAKDRAPKEDPTAEQKRWDRLARQAALEVQLVRLGDPEFPLAASPKSPAGARSADQNAARWAEYRKLGEELRGFYERLPGRIHEAALAKDATQAHRARRLLPLLDPRDVIADARNVPARLEEQLSSIVLPRIAIPTQEKPALDVTVARTSVELNRNGAWEAVAVRVASAAGSPVLLRLQYNAGLLEIRDREGNLRLRPNVSEQFSLDSKGERTLALEVRPLEAARFSPSALMLLFQAGRDSATRKIDFALASVDVVDLVIERITDREDKPETRVAQPALGSSSSSMGVSPVGQVGAIACDVFPNRTTAYAFALKNLSGKARTVTVQFWPAREGSMGDRPDAGGPDKAFQPGPDDRPLTPPIEVKLPASETAEPIVAAEPKPGEKAEPGKKEGPDTAKSPAEKPKAAGEKPDPAKEARPPGIDISYGVACVIRDPATRTSWTRWIKLVRLKPAAYLAPRLSYDSAKGEIQVNLKAVGDSRHRPLVSAEQPIRIDWETVQGAAGEAPGKPKRPTAELASPVAEDVLVAQVLRAPDRVVPVSLTVDGYPRAFVYSVPCDLPHPDVEPERSRAEVRIRAPKEGDAFASPLANDAPLWVEFQVDAPYDAFLQPDELVQAWLEVPGDTALAARPRQSFAGDRQWVVLWEGLSAQGVVKIDSKVHDFRVPLNTFRLTETKADVRVHLALPRHSVKARDAKVTVVLDEEPPKILRYVVESPVAKGADVPVSLELSDLSGIDRVLFGFVKNDAALLDEKDKLAEIPSADLAEKSELEFAVPTKEAKPEVMPGQKYYLAVRVWDRVGHTSQKVMPVTIAKPAAAAKLVETAGTITGQVLRRGHLYDNWTSFTVKLLKDGRPIDEVKGREDGTFQFKDVPPGAYTIEAEGFALDRLKGSGRVTVTGGPASVKIDAQPK